MNYEFNTKILLDQTDAFDISIGLRPPDSVIIINNMCIPHSFVKIHKINQVKP